MFKSYHRQIYLTLWVPWHFCARLGVLGGKRDDAFKKKVNIGFHYKSKGRWRSKSKLNKTKRTEGEIRNTHTFQLTMSEKNINLWIWKWNIIERVRKGDVHTGNLTVFRKGLKLIGRRGFKEEGGDRFLFFHSPTLKFSWRGWHWCDVFIFSRSLPIKTLKIENYIEPDYSSNPEHF